MQHKLTVKTSDGLLVEIPYDKYVKCRLLRRIVNLRDCDEFVIPLLVDHSVLEIVLGFNGIILADSYNPLEIYFSPEHLSYFDDLSPHEIINICKAANYLEYSYLLELCCKLLANGLVGMKNSKLRESLNVKGSAEDEYDWFETVE